MTDRRVALITGASRGVGAEVARQLAGPGRHIVVNYRDKDRRAGDVADEVRAAGAEASTARADLCDDHAVATMFDDIAARLGPARCVGAGRLRRARAPRRAGPRHAAEPRRAGGRGAPGAAADAAGRAHRVRHQPPGPLLRAQAGADRRLCPCRAEQARRRRRPAGDAGPLRRVRRRAGGGLRGSDRGNRGAQVARTRRSRRGRLTASRSPLPTVAEFARAIVDAVDGPVPDGRTIYVGGPDYLD